MTASFALLNGAPREAGIRHATLAARGRQHARECEVPTARAKRRPLRRAALPPGRSGSGRCLVVASADRTGAAS